MANDVSLTAIAFFIFVPNWYIKYDTKKYSIIIGISGSIDKALALAPIAKPVEDEDKAPITGETTPTKTHTNVIKAVPINPSIPKNLAHFPAVYR